MVWTGTVFWPTLAKLPLILLCSEKNVMQGFEYGANFFQIENILGLLNLPRTSWKIFFEFRLKFREF